MHALELLQNSNLLGRLQLLYDPEGSARAELSKGKRDDVPERTILPVCRNSSIFFSSFSPISARVSISYSAHQQLRKATRLCSARACSIVSILYGQPMMQDTAVAYEMDFGCPVP